MNFSTTTSRRAGRAFAGSFVLALALLTSCAAVFPELSTRIDKAPQMTLDPPPPSDRHYVRVVKGRVPPRTKGGQTWDQAFGSLPDPYVRVFKDGAEVVKTVSASDTLEPAWDAKHGGNFAIQAGDRLDIQLWDSNPLNDGIICKKDYKLEVSDMNGELDLELGPECGVVIELRPAKAVWGAGFWFELRRSSARVTRVLDASPASRAGLRPGDEIVDLSGAPVSGMSSDEVRSTLGSIPAAGIPMSVLHADGTALKLTVKEGPIYPLRSQYSQLPVEP